MLGSHPLYVFNNTLSVIFEKVDVMLNTPTHYRPCGCRALHKKCKITTGNKVFWGCVCLSSPDICFLPLLFFTHIYKGRTFHIFRLNTAIYLPCVMPRFSRRSKVSVTLSVSCGEAIAGVAARWIGRITICPCQITELARTKGCALYLEANMLVNLTVGGKNSPSWCRR